MSEEILTSNTKHLQGELATREVCVLRTECREEVTGLEGVQDLHSRECGEAESWKTCQGEAALV